MATQPFETRLSVLEQTMLELAQAQARTQSHLDQFHADTRAYLETSRVVQQNVDATMRRMEERMTRSDRRWGELANKMGTLTENIVLPGIPTVFRVFFGEECPVELAVRVRRRHRLDPGRMEEFDAVACGGDIVLVAESKSTRKPEYVSEFCDKLGRSRDFLPEATGKKVVGLLASFLLDSSLVTAGESQGLIMVGLGTGLLQVLNTPGFVPGRF